MTTDDLTERIARAIYGAQEHTFFPADLDEAPKWLRESVLTDAAAVLPIVEAEVRKAKAEAWGECATALVTKAREQTKYDPGQGGSEAEWADWRGWHYTWCAAVQHRTTNPYKETP